MKVKIIYSKPNARINSTGVDELEKEINEFIVGKKIIDIKFQREGISLCVLIIYEED